MYVNTAYSNVEDRMPDPQIIYALIQVLILI
jgi:hypothetical protein